VCYYFYSNAWDYQLVTYIASYVSINNYNGHLIRS
jgi:hypothetical protein